MDDRLPADVVKLHSIVNALMSRSFVTASSAFIPCSKLPGLTLKCGSSPLKAGFQWLETKTHCLFHSAQAPLRPFFRLSGAIKILASSVRWLTHSVFFVKAYARLNSENAQRAGRDPVSAERLCRRLIALQDHQAIRSFWHRETLAAAVL